MVRFPITRVAAFLATVAFAELVSAQSIPTTISLSSSANPANLGQSVRMTALLNSPLATGKIDFYDGAALLGSGKIANGTATFTTALLSFGQRSLSAKYPGDTTYGPSTSPVVKENITAKAGGGFNALPDFGNLGNGLHYPVVADVNGDGKADLIGTGFGNLEVWLGNGDGTFRGPIESLAAAFHFIGEVGVADFNGDGLLDAAVADSNGSINILFGNGDGTFGSFVSYPVRPDEYSICLGDFNGDGLMDVMTSNFYLDGVQLLLGNADGTFQPAQTIASGLIGAPVVADLNGDGHLDLIIPSEFENSLCVMSGNGDGTFQACVNYTAPESSFAAAGDVNLDGITDIVLSNAVVPGISVLLGNSDGTFKPTVTFPRGYTEYGGSGGNSGIALADFNADGIPDVIYPTEFVASIYFGVGDGTFEPGPSFRQDGLPGSLVVGDFNQDGITDLAAGSSYIGVNLGQYAPPIFLSSSNSVIPLGQGIVLTAVVRGTAPTGTVAFSDQGQPIGTAALVNGTATFSISQPALGAHSYQAAYTGNLPASNSGSIGVEVQQATKTALTATPSALTLGQTITLTATVTGTTDGIITFYDGNIVLGSTSLVNGQASLTTAFLLTGVQTMSAVFFADSGYLSSSANATVTVTAAPGGSIAQGPSYLLNDTPSYLVTGDFNQDHKLDASVSLPSERAVRTFFGNGDGTFQNGTQSNFQFTPGALAVDIINSGGYPGLVVADPSENLVWLTYCNPLNFGASFCTPVSPYATGANPSAIVIGDLNRDGAADMAVANAGSNSVTVFLRSCIFSCDFDSNSVSFAVGAAPEALALGDLNGDGFPDLIAANNGSANISVLLGKGDGTFQPAVNYPAGQNPIAIAISDFNGDGKLDVAIANAGSSTVSIFLGNGDGSLRSGASLNGGSAPTSIASADLNGDGRQDIAVASASGITVFFGNGDGTFGPANLVSGTGVPGTIAAGAFDGSGRFDLAAVIPGSDLFSLLLNRLPTTTQVTSPTASSTYGTPLSVTATVTPAISGGKVSFYDGVSIIGTAPLVQGHAAFSYALLSPGSHALTARYLGASGYGGSVSGTAASVQISAQPTFGYKPSTTTAFPEGLSILVVADFNNDGYADYAVQMDNGLMAVALGNGNEQFQVLPPFNLSALGAVTGDFNGDGKMDIVGVAGGSFSVLLGNGDGTFGSAYSFSGGAFGAQYTGPIATADFNRDGIPDLIASDTFTGNLALFLGNGDGTFQAARIFPARTSQQSIAIADFNRDGIPDVVVTTSGQGSALVLLGNGDGTLQSGRYVGMGSTPGVITLADFNLDGLIDLAITNPTSGVDVLLGNGDGTFRDGGILPTGEAPSAILSGDVNGDGYPDIVVANSRSNSLSVLLGNGAGAFETAPVIATSANPYGVAVAAFNANSTTDLLVITTDSNYLGQTILIAGAPIFGVLRGSPQAASLGSQFPVPFAVNAPAGASVVFSAPASGASGSFAGSLSATVKSAVTGVATAPAFTANQLSGSYQVTASMGSNFVDFSLTNTCSLGVTPSSVTTDSNGLTTSLAISGPPGCAWTLGNNYSWIALSATTGSGAGSVSVTIPPNTSGVERDGQITFNGVVLPVVQRGTAQIFADVPPSDYYFDGVNLLKQRNITSGCGASDYCPAQDVTRAQMAIFIVRAVIGGDSFTYSPTPYFTDVAPADFGFAWIQKLKELGITTGCGNNLFCPNETVSRAEMAIFIIRARFGANVTFTYPPTPYFTDVAPADLGFAWIQRLKEDLITAGCSLTLFCPANPVTRGDMAVFIMRGEFNQLLPAGTPVMLSVTPSSLVHGQNGLFTVTAANTAFDRNPPALQSIPGFALAGGVTVIDANTISFAIDASADAALQPISLWLISGSQQLVLPNAINIQ